MRKTVIASFALLGLFVGRAEAQTYMPFGPQFGVAEAVITGGGWTQCYSDLFGNTIGNNAEAVLTPCVGDNILMAGRAVGSPTFLLLAAAPLADATFYTGTGDVTTTHAANGSEWYFAPNWSWGFLALGGVPNKGQCDWLTTGADRFCLHTLSYVGGYRIGDIIGLNEEPTGYEKVFYEGNVGNVVPEPGSMALLATGLVGLYGVARRRREDKAVDKEE